MSSSSGPIRKSRPTVKLGKAKGPNPERDRIFGLWIDRVLETGENYLQVARDIGVADSTAHAWWNRAWKRGLVDEDTPGGPIRRLSKEENEKRRELLFRLVVLQGHTVEVAARRLHLGKSTADRWLAQQGVRPADLAQFVPGDPIPFEKLSDQARDCLEHFAEFRRVVLGRTWNPPWAVMCANELLELYHSGQDEFAVLNAPPGVGKSTLVTHDFAVWVIALERSQGREPRVLLGHRNWQKSCWYVKRVRTTFTDNPTLRQMYGRFKPESKLARWSVEELDVELLGGQIRSEKEPTVAAGSYDASVLSGRFSFVVWDDLIDKSNSTTADQRAKLTEWNDYEAESRLEPKGLYVISNSRYGPEDLSYSVTQQVDLGDIDELTERPRPLYRRLRFAAHDETKCDGEHHGETPWPDGCLLDPERVTPQRIRRQIAKNEGRFLLVWQQEDTDPAGNLAQKEWFTGGKDRRGAIVPGCFDYERRFGQLLYRSDQKAVRLSAVTLDPSSSHFWAMGHFLTYNDREHVLHRGLRRPLQAPDLLYPDEDNPGSWTGVLEEWWQASTAEGCPFTYFICEANAAQKWIMQYPFFQRWASSRQVTVIPHTTTINKTDRERGVEMLRPVYQFGKVHIPYLGYEERLFADAWAREACSWPEGQTSDLVMMHWFLIHRLDLLVATEIFETAEPDTAAIPTWAEHGAPSWATQRVGAGASLDRAGTLIAGR